MLIRNHILYGEINMQGNIPFTNGECPHCGNKFFGYNPNAWMYGSPVKTCKRCGKEYADSCYHEIEIDGYGPGELNLKRDIVLSVFCIAVFAVCFIIHYYQVTHTDHYNMVPAFLMVIAVLCFVFAIVDGFMIVTGLKLKSLEKKGAASAKRLQNKDYAEKLKNIGYNVPEKYLND